MARKNNDYRSDYRSDYESAVVEAHKAKERFNADVDAVIDALGLRDAYPNTTEEVTAPDYYGGWKTLQTTVYGRFKFLADIRLAADAARGAEASARIAAALKPKK